MIGHEASAYPTRSLCLFGVAAAIGAFDQLLHVERKHQHAFGRLDKAAHELCSRHIGNIFVLGNEFDFVVGKIAIVEAIFDG